MPITPFHGGFGLLFKGIVARHFSFGLFCCTQVVIDLESGYFLLRNEWPVHRVLHTFIGATLLCLAVVFALRPVVLAILRSLGRRPDLARWIDCTPAISRRTAVISAIAGVVGHVVPDAIMHYDVRPFAPFSDANPFYEFVSLDALHLGLVVAGFLGALVVAFSRLKVDAG